MVKVTACIQIKLARAHPSLAGCVGVAGIGQDAITTVLDRCIQATIFGIAEVISAVIAVVTELVVQRSITTAVDIAQLVYGARHFVSAQGIIGIEFAPFLVFVARILGAFELVVTDHRSTGQTALDYIANLRAVAIGPVAAGDVIRDVEGHIVHLITKVRGAVHSIIDCGRDAGHLLAALRVTTLHAIAEEVIVKVLWSMGDFTTLLVACIGCARVGVIDFHRQVGTVSGRQVASVQGARIQIVTGRRRARNADHINAKVAKGAEISVFAIRHLRVCLVGTLRPVVSFVAVVLGADITVVTSVFVLRRAQL